MNKRHVLGPISLFWRVAFEIEQKSIPLLKFLEETRESPHGYTFLQKGRKMEKGKQEQRFECRLGSDRDSTH